MNTIVICSIAFLLMFACLSCGETSPPGGRQTPPPSMEHLRVVIDREVVVAPAESSAFARNMAMGPDGTIWINSSNVQGGMPDNALYKSTDQGQTWTDTTGFSRYGAELQAQAGPDRLHRDARCSPVDHPSVLSLRQ